MNFNNKTAEINKVEEFYAQKRASQLSTVKNTSIVLCVIFAALCFLGGIASWVCNGMVDGNILLVVMGFLFVLTVVLAISAVGNFFGNKKKRGYIVESTENSLMNAKKIIDLLFSEYAQYLSMYDENDRVAEEILFAINR